jgi:zinc transporter ZupT
LLIVFPLTGGLTAYYTKLNKKTDLKLILAFAGAYLLSIVLFHLIPHLYEEISVWSGALLLGGFFFQVFLERFSRGVEHGHLHFHPQQNSSGKYIPYQILISLSLHSFMEGMPLGSGYLLDNKEKLSFLIGIVLHELPAAFAMVSILKATHFRNQTLLLFISVYSCMSALGAGSSQFLSQLIDEKIFEYLMAFVVGTFLHIATTILFENSENHRFSWNKILAIGCGIGLALLVSSGH